MKCEHCQPLIEDYFDGELEQRIASQVSAHMGSCSACTKLGAEIKLEREIYSRYHREVDVTSALWANVHARIQEEKQDEPVPVIMRLLDLLSRRSPRPLPPDWFSARLSPALATALVISAIAITVGVMSYLQSRTPNPTQVATKNVQEPPDAKDPNAGSKDPSEAVDSIPQGGKEMTPKVSEAPDQQKSMIAKKKTPVEVDPNRLVRQAEQKYLAAITILSRDLDSRRRQLDPETRARFDFALAEIDHTIYATQQAVRGNRSDPIALGYLLTAYSKKVEFLRDTARDETEANRPF
jgi:hypothetical protein